MTEKEALALARTGYIYSIPYERIFKVHTIRKERGAEGYTIVARPAGERDYNFYYSDTLAATAAPMK